MLLVLLPLKVKANGDDLAKLTNGDITVMDGNVTITDTNVNVVVNPDNATITDGNEATVTVTAVETAGIDGKFVEFHIGQIVAIGANGNVTTTGGTGTSLESFKTPTVWLAK